ncbi:MAG TPA: hypothetical protein ENJ30_06360, partial [Desulfobulbaceae bacterium]|nr:hypothetical protein [Desulfobulbaceae bacterium]
GFFHFNLYFQKEKIPRKAVCLWENGYDLCAIAPGKKYPVEKGWPKKDTAVLVKNWPPCHGVGVRTGKKVVGADVDINDKEIVRELLHLFDGISYITRVGMPPKTLIPVVCPGIKKKVCSDKWVDDNGVVNQIEILSYGQQFVAYGIHPETKQPYQWSGDLLTHELPVISTAMIDSLFTRFNELAGNAGWTNITTRNRKTYKIRKAGNESGNKPGDIYNRCCSITDVLEEYGWNHYRGNYWTRPGKKHGVSGTVFDSNTFYCFTSSTCLEPGRSYDCFGLLAMYEYGGDFSLAANAVLRTLREVR